MMVLKDSIWRQLSVLAALVVLAGCDGRYAVHGRVVYEDGSPLTEGTVVGEMSEGKT